MDNKKLVNIANTLKNLLEKSGIPVENLAVFGSIMKGSDNLDSDLDMIVISKAFENKSSFQRAHMLYKPETEFEKEKYSELIEHIRKLDKKELPKEAENKVYSEISNIPFKIPILMTA